MFGGFARTGGFMAWLTAAMLVVAPAAGPSVAASDHGHHAGGLSFSDELGGFDLVAVKGTGVAEDPIVIILRLYGIAPATLVIRLARQLDPSPMNAFQGNFLRAAISVIAINESGLGWVGFEFELQQELDTPSVYGDGLSFDQLNVFNKRPFVSNRFREMIRDLEPYDQVRFIDGAVDPGDAARFDINIIDLTPVDTFYLQSWPRIPAS